MAAITQTTYYGYVESPGGHRLIVQVGIHQFTAKGKTQSETVGFARLVSGIVTPLQAIATATKTALVKAYLPYISASQITQQLDHRVTVSRATGIISGLKFSYTMYGY